MLQTPASILMLFMFFMFSFTGYTQDDKKTAFDSYDKVHELINIERRSAQSQMQFIANPNTNDYDIRYHRLECTVDPAVHYISGAVTTYFVPTEANFSQVNFDFEENMIVDSVLYHGSSLSFSLSDGNLEINLPATVAQGMLDSISIEYHGEPIETGFVAFATSSHEETPVMWTLSEPYGAKTWWPCKQDLNDKIDSVDIIVSTPEAYRAASNGLLKSELESGPGFKTYHWKHRYPIPAYLIFIAITNYETFTDYVYQDNGDSIPILNYVYPEDLESAQDQLSATVEQMEFFNELFGLYPFADEKYGHAQMGWGGGMEHQTMSTMGSFSYSLQAHELAHQWFGDKITCGSWQDIWLNEGFATYLEALTREHFDSNEAFISWRGNTVDNITSKSDGSVFCSDTTSVGRIFDWRLSYQKGAMVLHMLRYKLGDSDFFGAIRNYLADPDLAFGYAKTMDLQNHLEAQSNKDLDEFFADWVMGEGHPSYHLEWDQSGDEAYFQIKQIQSHPSVSFYEMPVSVRVLGSGENSQWLRLENTENGQIFIENIDFPIISVQFDPETDLITSDNRVNYTPCLSTNEGQTIAAVDTVNIPGSVKVTSCEDGIIYLVPENTDRDLALIRGASIDSTVALANTPVEISLSGLDNGVYWLYARDSTENISEPEAFSIIGAGIGPISNENLRIYPNPTNELLSIETSYSGQQSFEITSLNGQQMLRGDIEGGFLQIDLSSFQKGAYFITFRSVDFVSTRKIIKL